MIKKYLVSLVFLFFAYNASADMLQSKAEIRQFADSLMEKVAEGNLEGAFENMKKYVNLSPTEIDAVAIQSKAQREKFGERYGAAEGFEFIDEKSVGTSLLRLRYIEKTKKHALPWKFYFYKTKGGWTLNSFFWNDQFRELFKQLGMTR